MYVDRLGRAASEMSAIGQMLCVRQHVGYQGAFEDRCGARRGRSRVEWKEEPARFQHAQDGRYHRRAWLEEQRDWRRLRAAFFENDMGNPIRETIKFIVRDPRRSRLDGDMMRKPPRLLGKTSRNRLLDFFLTKFYE